MNWKVFFTRTGSAIVFAIIMLAGLLGHLYQFPMSIFVLALLIQFLCIKEFFVICKNIFVNTHFPKYLEWITQILGIFLLVNIVFWDMSIALVAIIPAILLMSGILNEKTALAASFSGIVALLYIGLAMGFLVKLWLIDLVIPIALILMIWSNDSFAYIVGSFIGKTPFSKISPKKTWEGTGGGALITIIGTIVWAQFSPYKTIQTYDWVAMALFATVAGTVGDLLESKLKRMAGVKDSGNIMPGHGGALDRFDSLLLALPFAFCYFMMFYRVMG
ncbi:MAG TPA: phosphatidate cytidylyltransferase [Edaphocola sp.]|nr:phosphatidate cytidylyltransferase [Edaphocola sp.]